MMPLRNFLLFWYDFIVGDDWVVAAGVVLALIATALLAQRDLKCLVDDAGGSRRPAGDLDLAGSPAVGIARMPRRLSE